MKIKNFQQRAQPDGYTDMENYKIHVTFNKRARHFEVSDHPHHAGEKCKYKVFENKVFVASFEPDKHYILHSCQNLSKLDESLLQILAKRIEAELPYPTSRHIKKQ